MNTGEMIDYCLGGLGAGRQSNTRLTAKILSQLNFSYAKLLGKQNWRWLRMRTTVAVTATTIYVPIPTVVKEGVAVPLFTRIAFAVSEATGAPIHPSNEMLNAISEGRWAPSATAGRNTPQFFCVTKGTDGVTDELLFMPLPPGADTIHIWGLRSMASVKLVNLTDVPVLEEEYQPWLVHDALACLTAGDATYDPQVTRMHRDEAKDCYRGIMHTSQMKTVPPVAGLPWGGWGGFGVRR